MRLRVHRIAFPVTVLGPGRRLALWVQGCTRGCPGCMARDTWSADAGELKDVASLSEELAGIVLRENLDGLTVSGGEPVDQELALATLIKRMRMLLTTNSTVYAGTTDTKGSNTVPVFDVMLFTGCTSTELQERAPELLACVDAAACGPYLQDRPRGNALLATDNQELLLLNETCRERFLHYAQDGRGAANALQFEVDASTISLVGMPASGDLSMLRHKLKERGVWIEETTWMR